jgi:hypothetical protein
MKIKDLVIFRLHCLCEDGDDETEGYFLSQEEAAKKGQECEAYPRNKKYGIKYHIEFIPVIGNLDLPQDKKLEHLDYQKLHDLIKKEYGNLLIGSDIFTLSDTVYIKEMARIICETFGIPQKEEPKQECKECGGKGWYAQQTGDNEQEQRQCEYCDGGELRPSPSTSPDRCKTGVKQV